MNYEKSGTAYALLVNLRLSAGGGPVPMPSRSASGVQRFACHQCHARDLPSSRVLCVRVLIRLHCDRTQAGSSAIRLCGAGCGGVACPSLRRITNRTMASAYERSFIRAVSDRRPNGPWLGKSQDDLGSNRKAPSICTRASFGNAVPRRPKCAAGERRASHPISPLMYSPCAR